MLSEITFLVCINFRRSHSKIWLQYNYGNLDPVQCIRGPKWDDYNFPILNFSLLCSNIPAAPVYGVYISQLIRYSRACGSLIEGCCWQGSYCTKGSHWLSWSHHFESCTVTTMTWLTVRFVVIIIRFFPRLWLTTGFVTRVTRRVLLKEGRNCLPFRSICVQPRCFMRFVVFDL